MVGLLAGWLAGNDESVCENGRARGFKIWGLEEVIEVRGSILFVLSGFASGFFVKYAGYRSDSSCHAPLSTASHMAFLLFGIFEQSGAACPPLP